MLHKMQNIAIDIVKIANHQLLNYQKLNPINRDLSVMYLMVIAQDDVQVCQCTKRETKELLTLSNGPPSWDRLNLENSNSCRLSLLSKTLM